MRVGEACGSMLRERMPSFCVETGDAPGVAIDKRGRVSSGRANELNRGGGSGPLDRGRGISSSSDLDAATLGRGAVRVGEANGLIESRRGFFMARDDERLGFGKL